MSAAEPALRMRGVADIERHVWERLVVVAHVWPGINPFNVYDMTLSGWLVFAAAADQWSAERKGD